MDIRSAVREALKETGVKAGDTVSWTTSGGRRDGIVTDDGNGGLDVVVDIDSSFGIADVILSAGFRIENR